MGPLISITKCHYKLSESSCALACQARLVGKLLVGLEFYFGTFFISPKESFRQDKEKQIRRNA